MKHENPETALVRATLELLHANGIAAWRNNTGVAWRVPGSPRLLMDRPKSGKAYPVKFGIVGAPDILGWVRRRAAACVDRVAVALGVECKISPRKLTHEQWVFLNDLKAAGGLAYTVFDDTSGLIEAIRDGRSSDLGPCPPKDTPRAKRQDRAAALFNGSGR